MYKRPFHKCKRSYRNLRAKVLWYKTTITLCSNFSGSPSTVWIVSSTSSSVFRNSCEWTTNWSCFLSLHLPPSNYLMDDIVCRFYSIHQQWSEQTHLRTTFTSSTSSSIPSRGTSTTWRTSSFSPKMPFRAPTRALLYSTYQFKFIKQLELSSSWGTLSSVYT